MPTAPHVMAARKAELLHILGDCACGKPAKHIWTKPGGRQSTNWIQRARWRWVMAWRELEPVCDDCQWARCSAAHSKPRLHGTRTAYSRGCRCLACMAAARRSQRRRRASHKISE